MQFALPSNEKDISLRGRLLRYQRTATGSPAIVLGDVELFKPDGTMINKRDGELRLDLSYEWYLITQNPHAKSGAFYDMSLMLSEGVPVNENGEHIYELKSIGRPLRHSPGKTELIP